MTINNLDAFMRSLPDWVILEGCFGNQPSDFRPMDVDGLVERRGICLFLEHKEEFASLKNGQRYTFQTLARQGNTCIVYWTKGKRKRNVIKMVIFQDGEVVEVSNPSMTKLRRRVARWYRKADSR